MANQIARLKSSLANSKMQKENNALYQTVLGLINSLEATELKASRAISLSGSGGGSGSNITLSDLFPAAMLLVGGVNRNNSSSSSASSDPFPQIMMLMVVVIKIMMNRLLQLIT